MLNNIQNKIGQLDIKSKLFINGKFVEGIAGNSMAKISPANNQILPNLVAGDASDIDLAVKAAVTSYNSNIWREMPPSEKKKILYSLADLMEDNLEELALLDALETGRSLKNYMFDSIPKAISTIRWFAEAVDKVYDHAIPMRKNSFATITKEPLGVVGLITPWNDPLVVAAWKFSPALLMGNSIVIKPAEQSSFSILKVAELSVLAGFPPGVFNVVTGSGDVAGKALAMHNDVSGIFFTGSSDVGKLILQYSGKSNMKKVGLECGGKSPFFVSNLCGRLPEAAAVLAKNVFYNQGQICSAPSRLIVHTNVKKEFISLLASEAKKYIPSDSLDIDSEVGCVVTPLQKMKIESYISSAILNGANIIEYETDKNYSMPLNGIMPTIFDDVDPDSSLAQDEIFGPVLSVITVNSIEDAISVANNTKYGLAASIWSDDLDETYHFSRLVRAGIVHINSYGADDETTPFGGVKESGLGKDKSVYAFDEYSVTKTIWSNYKPYKKEI
jgi:acyl-CoA reductase-like NAD-dependent aldehyde dehydrogenase